MAERPVFVPGENSEGPSVLSKSVEFEWNPGFAMSQKRKNIIALHEGARKHGIQNVLEISSKSESAIGQQLSAFNLTLRSRDGREMAVESAFQGSKVFEEGGPYTEYYEMNGRDIRKDSRLRRSGKLIAFEFYGCRWKLEPKTAFYDWLYLHALYQNKKISEHLLSHDGFTDIEFNPKKQINCQARSAALYVFLERTSQMREYMENAKQLAGVT